MGKTLKQLLEERKRPQMQVARSEQPVISVPVKKDSDADMAANIKENAPETIDGMTCTVVELRLFGMRETDERIAEKRKHALDILDHALHNYEREADPRDRQLLTQLRMTIAAEIEK